MKFRARIDGLGELHLRPVDGCFGEIGEVELDVKPAKKWVKKEAFGYSMYPPGSHKQELYFSIPGNARNAKLFYEVEE